MKIHCFLFLAQSAHLAAGFVNSANNNRPSRLFNGPEILAEEGTWQAYLDEESTGLIYYFDNATGESLWEPPTDTFPEVKLPRKKQRLADDLRREYRQSIDFDEAEDSTSDSNWFSGFFDAKEAAQEVVEEEPVVIEPVAEEPVAEEPASAPWSFGGITGGLKQEAPSVDEEVVTEAPSAEEPAKKDWFGGIFGDAKAKEETIEEPPVVEKKDIPKRGILESFTGMKASTGETVVTKEEKVAQQPRAAKKKDPKIAEPVKEKPKPKKKEPTIEVNRADPIKIEIASNIVPHPAKVMWGGEDAVFTKGRTFGVFDGVSGASKLDGVPLYSRTLANEMKKKVGNEGLNVQEMTKLLTDAADVADAYATGASTAVVASIGENGFLQALNVGDSCCMVIRDGKVAAKTREISHYWECPYQLSSDSPDRPKDGTKLNVELTPGDLILMGSDGIFDNVSDDMILDTVGTGNYKASQIAKKICKVSRQQSLDKESVTPYSKQAQRRGIPEYQYGIGGKVDDIGCVVVVCK